MYRCRILNRARHPTACGYCLPRHRRARQRAESGRRPGGRQGAIELLQDRRQLSRCRAVTATAAMERIGTLAIVASALSVARWRWRSRRSMPLIGSSVPGARRPISTGAAPGHHRRNRVGRAGCQSRRDLCCDAGGADASHLRTAVAARLGPRTIITDGGSTKQDVIAESAGCARLAVQPVCPCAPNRRH